MHLRSLQTTALVSLLWLLVALESKRVFINLYRQNHQSCYILSRGGHLPRKFFEKVAESLASQLQCFHCFCLET